MYPTSLNNKDIVVLKKPFEADMLTEFLDRRYQLSKTTEAIGMFEGG